MQERFEIHQATEQDIPIIYRFIKELAEFHQLSHLLEATEDKLKEMMFGSRVYAEAIIGCLNQTAVSYALYTYNFSTLLGKPGLYLVDLYVSPLARKKHIAQRMLVHLAKFAKKKNLGRFEWSVLADNKQAIALYEKIGAQALSEWITYRVSGEKLERLAAEVRED